MRRTILIFLSAAFLICGSVSADIIGVTSVAFTGTAAEHEFINNPAHLINGNGLSGALLTEEDFDTVTHESVDDLFGANAWATSRPNNEAGDFFQVGGAQGTVVFEFTLDQLYTDIDEMVNWGYHFGGPNGNFASAATLDFSTDGGATFSSPRNVTIAGTAGNSVSNTFAAADADVIRLTITDNHFGAFIGGDRVGLAEIRFANTVAVPEPASSSLAVFGICCVGFFRRRRNRV